MLAVSAEATANVERQAHPVADLDPNDAVANFGHLPKVLMAKHAARFHIGPAFIHVQVRPADVGACDFD